MAVARIRRKRKRKLLWPGQEPEWYYYFTLIGDNNEPISQSEQYTAKSNVVELLRKYFPNFAIDDLTK